MLIYKDIIRCIKRYKIKAYLLLGGGSLAFIVFSTFFSSVIVGSQVTDLTNVTKYHAAGYKGQGVKCIIIDGDWAGWSTLKDQGIVKGEHAWDSIEYHTHLGDNYIGFGHGAGMIQAFHDMAPEAEIYLYNSMFFQADNIANTLNYFRTEGISLVSYSLNNTNIGFDFLTGNDTLTKNLDDYTGNSVTVCVIAGNYANNTSSFHLEKESGTNNMLFPNGTRNLDIVVSDAPAFDITITRSGFQRRLADYTYTLTNQSTGVQIEHNANQPVRKVINVALGQARIGDILRLNITKIVDTVDYLDIIIGDFGIGKFRLQNPGEMNKASSVAIPGASKKAITTGAVLISNYNVKDEISPISGWGPIPQDVDELGTIVVPYTIKPELCAPSEGGATSPTAPRVAGALAVLASAGKVDLTKPEEVKRILTTKHVIQMGGSVNNMFGHGRLYLDADTDGPPPTPNPPVPVDPEDKNILICPNPVSLSVDSYVKIANFSQDVSKLEARIYNINGEFVRSFSILELQEELNRKTLRWDLRNENGSKVAPGVYFISIKTDSGKNQIRKIAIQK